MSGRPLPGAQDAALRAPSAEDTLPVRKGVKKSLRIMIYIAAAALVLLLWNKLSRLLFQVLFAAGLSLGARPIAGWYEKKLSRPLSCLCAVLTLFLLLAGVIALLIPPLVSQFRVLLDQFPRLLTAAQGAVGHLQNSRIFSSLIPALPADLPGQMMQRISTWVTEQAPRLLSGLAGAAEKISQAFISPVLCYYFLRDRETFCYQLSLWIPIRHRKRMLVALREARREAGSYLRGQLLVALCVGALTAAGLMIAGVPAYLVLGLVMGICEVIPYVGPILGGIPIVLFSWPLGMSHVLWAIGVTIAVQQLESIVIAPRLMAGATGLHPVYVILLLTAGGMLFGLSGMLLALPVFVCFRGLIRIWMQGG